MKKLAPIALLVLLLYHILGPSLAMLSFEQDYLVTGNANENSESVIMKMYLPELPYSPGFQASEQIEALIRQGDQFYNPTNILHEGDTLYVTLTSNQAARDRFFELAGAMERLASPDQDNPRGANGKLAKLFSGLLKNYLPDNQQLSFTNAAFDIKLTQTAFSTVSKHYNSATLLLHNPPPERC